MKKILCWAAVILAAVGLGLIARENVIEFVTVAGDSMENTLRSGDVAAVTKFDYVFDEPSRYEIALLEIPGRDGRYIKRIIGLPGETVEIIDGTVYINGRELEEKYAGSSHDDHKAILGPNEYFVMGDNRSVSYDSREEDIGAVSADCFQGRVRAVIWPLGDLDLSID